MRLAFVTGGTGFLGLNLVERLTGAGWEVVALHRPTSDTRRLARFPVRLVEGVLHERSSLERAFPQAPDAVFHVAANTSIWSRNDAEQTRDNVTGTETILDVARAKGAKRFVQVSTWNTFGLEHYQTIDEDTPQRGAESWINYTRSKSLAEQAVKRAAAGGLPAVVVNPSHIMGRYDTSGWARMITMVAKGTLPGVPPGAGSFCHAEAVADALIAAAERGRPGGNYLLGGTDASFMEVFQVIGRMLDRPVPKRPLPAFAIKLAARIQVLRAALTGREPDLTPEGAEMVLSHPRIVSTKARDELGYRTVPLETMVRDSLDWLKADGRI